MNAIILTQRQKGSRNICCVAARLGSVSGGMAKGISSFSWNHKGLRIVRWNHLRLEAGRVGGNFGLLSRNHEIGDGPRAVKSIGQGYRKLRGEEVDVQLQITVAVASEDDER